MRCSLPWTACRLIGDTSGVMHQAGVLAVHALQRVVATDHVCFTTATGLCPPVRVQGCCSSKLCTRLGRRQMLLLLHHQAAASHQCMTA